MNKKHTKKTVVLNLYGGQGTGKSTMAANIFAKLKWCGIDCEIVGEYAKELVWQESFPKMSNQIYILAKQHNKQWMLDGKVDVIVTDSPLLLGPYYDQGRTQFLMDLTLSEFNKFDNINVYLKRQKNYNPNGRMQTEDGAREIDGHIKDMLVKYDIKHTDVDAVESEVDSVVDMVLARLEEIKTIETVKI